MSVTVPNGLIMMGTSLLFLDYIDRRFLITRDLAQLSTLLSIKREYGTLSILTPRSIINGFFISFLFPFLCC